MSAKAYEIIPGKLYMRSAFIDFSLEKKLALLERYGVDVVVNLWHRADEEIRPHLYDYIHEYFPDGKDVDEVLFWDLAYDVLDHIDDGHTVLVHCYGGKNRSGLICALAFAEYEGVSGMEALEHIRKFRHNAVDNEHFQEILRRV